MSSVQIDPDKFLEMMAAALKASVIPQKIDLKELIKKVPEKKRGRPAKAKKEIIQVEPDEVDETVDEILAFKPPESALEPGRALKNTAAAKRVGWRLPNGNQATATESVVNFKRKQRFVDDRTVAQDSPEQKQKYQTTERTERRPPAQKMEFKCDRCRNNFELYPSEIPQAFMREKDPLNNIESKPTVKCPDCMGKPL